MFKHRGVLHVFFQHILTPEYSGARPTAEYRTCWAHAASKDLVRWRTWGCVGSWDRSYGVAFDGALLGLDASGTPTLLFDGLEHGTHDEVLRPHGRGEVAFQHRPRLALE